MGIVFSKYSLDDCCIHSRHLRPSLLRNVLVGATIADLGLVYQEIIFSWELNDDSLPSS